MYFFNPPLVEYAIDYFKNMNCTHTDTCDQFWRLFGPGNTVYDYDRPFERLCDYEEMLDLLRKNDNARYKQMHKGSPFYLMAWLAFDLHDFKKALFYLDAAISEDVRQFANTDNPDEWKTLPGASFLLLRNDQQHAAQRAVDMTRTCLSAEVERFNKVSVMGPMTMDAILCFATRFLDGLHRTIISALYIFLMETRERFQELIYREGSGGGSNEPFTVHLFIGGLLLESILRHYYPKPTGYTGTYTIGSIYKRPDFLADFSLQQNAPTTSADTLQEILDAISGSNSIHTAFSTAAKLRNTTGHNLIWDDVFSEPAGFKALCDQIINAAFHVIRVKAQPQV